MPGVADSARGTLLRVLERVVESASFAKAVKLAASFRGTARVLNSVHLGLRATDRAYAHALFSRLFREGIDCTREGRWDVEFAGKTIRIPLNPGRYWLDWDTALSITGHDIEVKQTYARILASPGDRPDWFIDVGANYGTHSLLFLAHGINTLTFEPNRSCHDYFLQMCRLNGVTPSLEPVALGEVRREVDLAYPRSETWLGSIGAPREATPGAGRVVERVVQVPLDEFAARFGTSRLLIKIDTEGSELAVLKGAERILRENRPWVIFESLAGAQREPLLEFFARRGYATFALPWDPAARDVVPQSVGQVLASSDTNFIAVPAAR